VTGNKANMTAKNTAVLSLDEFKKMRDRTQIRHVDEETEIRQMERQEIKERSDARVHNWPNTIQALRKKRDDVKFENFKKDEEERRRIDLDEAQYQAGVKREILGQANKQLYEGTDRVKSFQSALLLADTLQEREAQKEINQKKKEIAKYVDERWNEVEKENMRAYDEKEEEKKIKEIEKVKANQKVLKHQHDEFRAKNIRKMQEKKIEGEIVKLKAKEEIVKQKEEEKAKREKALAAQEETRIANDLLQEIKEQERQRELEHDRKIQEFAKKKEEIMEMRKMREELKFKERQDVRQKIIDDQVERLRKLKNKEDEILNKQIKEAEIKAEENERIAREKREQLIKEIDKQIALTLKNRKVEKEAKKVEDKNFQEFWKQKNKELEDKDIADQNAYKERCKHLSEYHKKQTEQKEKELEKSIKQEFKDAMRMKAAIDDEERIFQSYAEKCITEWKDNGKNIKPLLLELENYKKKMSK
jgi:hypothetical protein